ncbi:MAG: RsmB/NOP family class I SAM-dependent RNA methyltransferase, partial [Chitinophagaceae bacterium]|nr:RsmB/NOP family class I SAM-dependent RNA methyltransferase [Chitinophagaceae bacterium]
MLPAALLQSLADIPGFDAAAFEAVHAAGAPPVSIRLNPGKQPAGDPGWEFGSQVPWCPYGRYLPSRPSFTLDPLLHAGAYYVQEASSMFLWHIFQQLAGADTKKKLLDLCGAPGGKSTLIASYFRDGLVVTNEVIKQRAQVLVENITKWGGDNTIVTNNDPSHFKSLPGYFDILVADAPCSGSGLFRKDPDAISEWSEDNVALCSQRQQRILADALPALKADGFLVYCTCSYSVEEDEAIGNWLVNEMDMEGIRIPLNADWGIVETSLYPGSYGYRFYPDRVKGEGFFAAVFRKRSESTGRFKEQSLAMATKQELQQLFSFITIPEAFSFFRSAESIRAIRTEWLNALRELAGSLYIKKAGVEIGSIKGRDIVPS